MPTKNRYATGTTVPIDRTIQEITTTLKRYGASRMAYLEDQDAIHIAFSMHGRNVRFSILRPALSDVRNTPTGRQRSLDASMAAQETEFMRRGRAVLLMIKARLEAIENGIETMDQAFMAYILLPSGEPIGAHLAPQIEAAYQSDETPRLLLPG